MASDVRGDNYRISAIKAAKDLGYDKDVIKRLKAAKTENEIERIMREARTKRQYEEERWVDRITIKKSVRK